MMAMSAMSAPAVTAGSSIVSARECQCIASSTSNVAFGSAVRFAPVANSSRAVRASTAVVRATASSSSQEIEASARRALVGVLAAGAILVSGVPALALSGPGGDGAAATAKGADVLLKKADKLTKKDSPARFGEGLKGAGSTATQAGSAAASNVQDVADAAVTKAKENLSKAKASFGKVIVSKDNKVGDAKGLVNGLGDKVKGGVNAGNVASDVKRKAGSAIGDAKSNLPSVPSVPSLPEKKAGQKF